MASIPEEIPPGTVLGGRWRIHRTLGGGGMGAVYEAVQIDLGRRVAIKTVHPALRGDQPQLERFRREAEAAARLHHPNIVQVTDYGDSPPHPPFLVMEYLDAPSLQQLAQRETLGVARLAAIAQQVLAALEVAHAAGIVHRDLKPGNIVIVPLAGGADLAKLIDFGIARLAEGEGYKKLTQTGAIVGTPVYMPPEQALGKPVDARCDLYALGVILYRILAGRPPFSGANLGELLPQILGVEPVPLRELRQDVPPAFAEVIHCALRKDREERWASAAAMSNAIRDALAAPERVSPDTVRARPAAKALAEPEIPTTQSGRGAPVPAPPSGGLPTPTPTPATPTFRVSRRAAILFGAALALFGVGVAIAVYAATLFLPDPSSASVSPEATVVAPAPVAPRPSPPTQIVLRPSDAGPALDTPSVSPAPVPGPPRPARRHPQQARPPHRPNPDPNTVLDPWGF